LLAGAHLHDIFHVGLHKRFTDEPPSALGPLPPIRHGRAYLRPVSITQSSVTRGQLELLVHWADRPVAEEGWIDVTEFHALYPEFQRKDELLVRGAGIDVMLRAQYSMH
jgi:hypothetical protein